MPVSPNTRSADPVGRRGRLDELTAVRGVAALMVVLYHARGSWHPIFASGERITSLVATGWIWVHFFFVLSGFVMMEAYGRDFAMRIGAAAYGRFLFIRFGRIYPLHLATLAAMAALVAAGWIAVVDPPGSFVSSLALVQGFTFVPLVWNEPAWSISTEWYTYLLFPFMVPLVMRIPATGLRVAWCALAMGIAYNFLGSGDAPAKGDAGAWPLNRLAICVVEFLLGCVIHRLVALDAWPRLHSKAIASLAFVLPLALLALPHAFDRPWLHAVVGVWFGISIGVLATGSTWIDDLLTSRLLQFLGVISYSIYLNHEILFSVARHAADAWFGRPHALHDLPTTWAVALFPLYVAVLIAVSWATWRWIEEPLRRLFKHLARREATKVMAPAA